MLRGLESVVAAVLLIIVVGVVLVYLWFSGYVGRYTAEAGQAVAAEKFKVEAASLAADGSVRLFIRNIGGAPANVYSIRVSSRLAEPPMC